MKDYEKKTHNTEQYSNSSWVHIESTHHVSVVKSTGFLFTSSGAEKKKNRFVKACQLPGLKGIDNYRDICKR